MSFVGGIILKAKSVSKWAMICGALVVILYNAGYLIFTLKIPTFDEQKSILLAGASLIIVFSPVYLNLILDKIVEIVGKNKSEEGPQ